MKLGLGLSLTQPRAKGVAGIASISNVNVSGSPLTLSLDMTTSALSASDDVGFDYWIGDAAIGGATVLPHAADTSAITESAAAGTAQSLSVNVASLGMVSTAGDGYDNTIVIKPWIRVGGASGTKVYYTGGIAWTGAATFDTGTETEGGTFNTKHGVMVLSEDGVAIYAGDGAGTEGGEDYTYDAADVGNTVTRGVYLAAAGASDNSEQATSAAVAAAGVVVLGTSIYTFSSQVGAASTSYVALHGSSLNATEGNRQYAVAGDVTLTDLAILTNSAQPGTGDLVVTVRKNGSAAGAITKTIAAGAAAGVHTASGSMAFTAGDLLSIELANAAAGNSAELGSIYLKGA